MALKATLKIQLMANNVLVAESDDEELWRQVLTAMQQGARLNVGRKDATSERRLAEDGEEGDGGEDDPVATLASEIGASVAQVRGACDPSKADPFIHLDTKLWEAFKKNTPARGPGAIAAVKLSATFLCLWFKAAGIKGRPTVAQALAVLEDIGASDRNPSRSIANCDWLQSRGDGIQVNPARHSMAIRIARAFCTGSPIEGGGE